MVVGQGNQILFDNKMTRKSVVRVAFDQQITQAIWFDERVCVFAAVQGTDSHLCPGHGDTM